MEPSSLRLPAEAEAHFIPWGSSPEEDARQMVELCQAHGIQTGVADHYRMDAAYQQILNEAGLRWLQFGNTGHSHPLLAHLVHDASPNARPESYRSRAVLRHTQFLTGPGHALVAEPFVRLRTLSGSPPPNRRPVDSLLLTFGGGDDRGATLAALGWLEAAGFQGRRVILSSSLNPSLPKLRDQARLTPNIELHVDNWSPAQVMAGCQLALCAGGTTLHELACLGIPALMVTIADNQLAPAAAWEAAGMGLHLGPLDRVQPEAAQNLIHRLLSQPNRLAVMAQTCRQMQDGCGAARVARALLQLDRKAGTPAATHSLSFPQTASPTVLAAPHQL